MDGYWITFTDGTKGYCEGTSPYDAIQIAEKFTGKTATFEGGKWDPKLKKLPYPANPIIWQFEHPVSGKCPAFCHKPNSCAGHSSCPENYACSE